MIGSLSSRWPLASQTKGAFARHPGVLGIGVPLRQRTSGVTEAGIAVNARAVLLEDVVGLVDSSGMRRLTARERTGRERQEKKEKTKRGKKFILQ